MSIRSVGLQLAGVLLLGVLVLLGCSGGDAPSTIDSADASTTDAPEPTEVPTTDAPATTEPVVPGPTFHGEDNPPVLSDWGQVMLVDGSLRVADGVLPYSLNSPLFSDYAHKLRTVWLPEGADPAGYDDTEVFDFPVGTVISKTFWYPRAEAGGPLDVVARYDTAPEDLDGTLDLDDVRLVETRILVHRETGWEALPYVWDEAQTEATLQRTGDLIRLTLTADGEDTAFPYIVPNVNQCAGCHATNHTTKELLPIGPKARHLNRNVDHGDGLMPQLATWAERGLVADLPAEESLPVSAVWDDASSPLDERARAYLDVNCAHCHNSVGPADTSGLFLEPQTELGPRLGICKPPIAAGTGTGDRTVGIHPGDPTKSILVFRMETEDPGAMMPELGRAVIHAEGVELISAWIESLEGDCAS